jgi:virulence factor Mce-like protein
VAQRTRRLLAIGAVAAAAVVAVLVLSGGRSHSFSTVLPAATNLIVGNQINAGGHNIGSVTHVDPVQRGRAARVEFEIVDEQYWPIPSDSTLTIRFGSTVTFANRHVLLERGRSESGIPEGGTFPTRQVHVPVEIDDLVDAFSTPVRHGLRSAIDNSALVYDASKDDLNALLPKAPATLGNASAFIGDLNKNGEALGMMIDTAAGVTHAIQESTPGLRTLIDGAGRTFAAIGDEADALQVALGRFPDALRQTRVTLAKADGTLVRVGTMSTALRPGIRELRDTAPLLVRTLDRLRPLLPLATRTVRKSGGFQGIGAVFAEGGYAGPRLVKIGRRGTKAVDCIRPYAPEIAALGAKWGDFISPVDDRDHILRAQVENFLPAAYNSTSYKPSDIKRTVQGLEYGFPRPPGTLAGQPWFQPQCGAGPEALDPDADTEAKHLNGAGVPPDMTGGSR